MIFLLTLRPPNGYTKDHNGFFQSLLPGFCSIISFCLIKVFKTAGFAVSSTGFGKSPKPDDGYNHDAGNCFFPECKIIYFPICILFPEKNLLAQSAANKLLLANKSQACQNMTVKIFALKAPIRIRSSAIKLPKPGNPSEAIEKISPAAP